MDSRNCQTFYASPAKPGGLLKELVEAGVASALNGSNLRLIHSFSCNSQKKVRMLAKMPHLLEGRRGFPSIRRRLRLGLQYSPIVSRLT